MEGGETFDIFRSAELDLFASAGEVPNWQAGHQARFALAHVLSEISEAWHLPKETTLDLSSDDVETIRLYALLCLGGVALRAIGSAECLIACGHVPEAATPARRLIEAEVRARSIDDDPTGDHARAWLRGRPLGTPARLLHRYRGHRLGSLYSNTAHADFEAVARLQRKVEGLVLVTAPHRDEEAAQFAGKLLNVIGSTALMLIVHLVSAFKPSFTESTYEEIRELEIQLGITPSAFVHGSGPDGA